MADITSKFQRVYSITADTYGVDPLKDRYIPLIMTIQTFTQHDVSQDERGSPDLISLREYKTDELWWVILAYNRIGKHSDIVEGVTLLIPNLPSVISILSRRDSVSGVAGVIAI